MKLTRFFLVFSFGMMTCVSFSQNRNIDIFKGEIKLHIDPYQSSVSGQVLYTFLVKKSTDTLVIDAKNINFRDIRLNRRKVHYTYDDNQLFIIYKYKPKTYKLRISYQCYPKKGMYFVGWQKTDKINQVWTQGQGPNNSHWLPSFDNANEKILFTCNISFPKPYSLLASGTFKKRRERKDKVIWKYQMNHPMSSYLLAIVSGNYNHSSQISKSGIDIQNYFYPTDSLKAKITYSNSKEIFDFLEKEIGVPYPWSIYRQVPVKDFIHGGMENTTLTIFPDTDLVDSTGIKYQNIVEVSSHELAHHWFGNMVTAKDPQDHWLQEGFATYYSLLTEKEIFGEDFFYGEIFEIINRLPTEDGILRSRHASSFVYYQKGAFVLYLLNELLGKDTFRKAVKTYLKTYQYQSASTEDFIKTIENVSGKNLSEFSQKWIYTTQGDYQQIIANINLHPKLNSYLEVLQNKINGENIPKAHYPDYKNILILSTLENKNLLQKEEILSEILDVKSPICNQYLLYHLDNIPLYIKPKVINLLQKGSYQTISMALERLCETFPNECSDFLGLTENTQGDSFKNVRLSWLKSAIKTDFKHKRINWLNELNAYTVATYPYQTRQNAFETIRYLESDLSAEGLKSLISGCVHYYYLFRKYCRNYLNKLYLDRSSKFNLKHIYKELEPDEQSYLKSNYKL